ncbi:glycosyl hydrolase family 28-related protein [Planctomycetota bacterium]
MSHQDAGLLVVVALLVAAMAAADELAIPDEAGFVNVRKTYPDRLLALAARGDGRTDDTIALKAILGRGKGDKGGAIRSIYLPDGVYLVRDTIAWGDKKKDVRGQSRKGTVIRLKDNCPGFQSPAKPKPVLHVQFGHAGQNFFQRLRNVTVDVGKGNPGAIGIHFHTSNGGGITNVTIRSSDPVRRGHIGLYMPKWPGPGLARDVLIEGFDTGVFITSDQYSWVFDRLTLRSQRKVGFVNAWNSVSIRRLHSVNKVTAVENRGKMAHMCLVDAILTGGAGGAAIRNHDDGALFARNVRTEGYVAAIANQAGTGKGVKAPVVDEFTSHGTRSLFGSATRSLNLPHEDPPNIPSGDPSEWAYVTKFGARPVQGSLSKAFDSGPAIQKAIDSGAHTVVVPAGTFVSRQSLRVRGAVRRVVGFNAHLIFRVGDEPAWIIEDGEAEAVAVDVGTTYGNQCGVTYQHASKRTLVAGGGSYVNTVPGGKVFMEDFCAVPLIFDRQQAWLTMANTESYDHNPHIVNFGGDLVILGLKTEKDRPLVGTYDGGRTEVLGGLLYKNRKPLPEAPAFIVRDSAASLCYRNKGHAYAKQVEETRGFDTKALASRDMPAGSLRMTLYSSRPKGVVVPRPILLKPGQPLEILGIHYNPKDPKAMLTATLHYRPKGTGAAYSAQPLKHDDHGRFNGVIPGKATSEPVEFYVEVAEGGQTIRSPLTAVAADAEPPALLADPYYAVHPKFGPLVLWKPAVDDTRVSHYRIYRGKARDEMLKTLYRQVPFNVYHVSVPKPRPAEWFAVQPVDLAGRAGKPRFVQRTR